MISARFSLELIYFNAGGGHRSATLALQKAIAEKYPDWEIRLVNLQELLKPIDPFYRLLNIESENIYNKALKNGFTYCGDIILSTVQKGIRFYSKRIEQLLQDYWVSANPDLVVSLVPNFNGVMFRALREAQPETPYVTIMTDIADCPPHFWQEKQDQYMICGSDMAVEQALALGYAPERVIKTSGMIINPTFYQPPRVSKDEGRKAIGLAPDLPTALIMFGGNGSRRSIDIVANLQKSHPQVQTIVMCGHNETLRDALEKYPRCHAVGFTDKVADYMDLADFFIGKPGPGSMSEALHKGLPVLLEEGARIMPQERYNPTWIKENQLGLTVASFDDIGGAVAILLEADTLERYRKNVLTLNNRAVYEIPDILAKIIDMAVEHHSTGFAGTDISRKILLAHRM